MNSLKRSSLFVFCFVLIVNGVCATKPVPNINNQALIQADAEGTATEDEALVTQALGTQQVKMETLKEFIRKRSVSDVGLMGDLITRAACIVRLEQQSNAMVSASVLQEFLTNRELSISGSKDDLLDRSCEYLQKEMQVQKLFGRSIGDVTKDELKDQLTSLGLSNSGTKPELISRLGKAHQDIQTIKKLLNDQTFDPSRVSYLLVARGLSTDGTNSEMLSRLADYLVSSSQNSAMPGVSQFCDMVTQNVMCLQGGRKMIVPDAVPNGLVGRWTFDDLHMFDSSGNANHIKEAGSFGPGLHGLGQSAKFDGSSMIEIPHSESLLSPDFCVTYWLYLLSDSTGQWRTILHKGSRDNERTPTFFLEPQTRGVEFFVSTTDDNQQAGERLWSNTFIPLRKWTHIAGCVEGRSLRLFINGILDAENTTIGTPIMNHGPIYIGNDPWRPAGGAATYIDELKYYSRVLTVDEIQAEAQAALGLVEPSFVELGCMGCSLDNCPKTCRQGFRMCTQRDLYSGGFFVARSMGWATTDTRIWKAEDGKSQLSKNPQEVSGLCMCCRIGEESS